MEAILAPVLGIALIYGVGLLMALCAPIRDALR